MADEPDTQDGTEEEQDSPTPDPVDAPQGGQQDDWDRDRAMRTIRAQRDSEKELRARIRELEDAQKTEEQRQQDELAALREQAAAFKQREARWRAERAVMEHAPRAGITDVALAMKVINPDDIEFGEDGSSNVQDVLTALIERHPALAGETPRPKPTSTDARKGRAPAEGPKLSADEQAIAARMGMTPEEYARFKGVKSADEYAAIAAATKE